MFILDTDHATLIQRGGAEALRIEARVRQMAGQELCITIISYEEQLYGRLAEIRREHSIARQYDPYMWLGETLNLYCSIRVLPFDAGAIAEFQRLSLIKVGVGPMDLKIASIALVNDATLLSRNLKDFQRVPGLRCEDWTL